MASDVATKICIVGAGPAGLITAHTLLQDGFCDVEVLTRDASPGGVWSADRVYPGLSINNVHGEFRFSSLGMPSPCRGMVTGGRLSGEDMQLYMEEFASRFLANKIKYNTEVLNIRPVANLETQGINSRIWYVTVKDTVSGAGTTLQYDKVILCTGGCSEPRIPAALSQTKADAKGFLGPVIHSSQFGARRSDVLSAARSISENSDDSVIVIGGGKSAQDISAYLANEGRRVSMVFSSTDAILAAPIPYPDFIRRSRLLSIFSPHVVLKTRVEKFLHTTWIGQKIVRSTWDFLTWLSFKTLSVPRDSPLRCAPNLFWTMRTNDEGIGVPNGFYDLVKRGSIDLISPARASSFADDGQGIVLSDARILKANAVILATGYTSSWNGIFNRDTREEIGLDRHVLDKYAAQHYWKYTSLSNPPGVQLQGEKPMVSIYRGLSLLRISRTEISLSMVQFHRFMTIKFATNNDYLYEVAAHWIASYFRRDRFLHLPESTSEALAHADKNNEWLQQRYPGAFLSVNESYSGDLAFWSWPQAADTLLEDMRLRTIRSGGNALTWPFKVIDLEEIKDLGLERPELRAQTYTASGSVIAWSVA